MINNQQHLQFQCHALLIIPFFFVSDQWYALLYRRFFNSHDREFHVASLPYKPDFKVMPEGWDGTTRDPDEVLYEISMKEDKMLYEEFVQRLEFNKKKVRAFIGHHLLDLPYISIEQSDDFSAYTCVIFILLKTCLLSMAWLQKYYSWNCITVPVNCVYDVLHNF